MKELFQGWLSQWSDCTLSTSPRENRTGGSTFIWNYPKSLRVSVLQLPNSVKFTKPWAEPKHCPVSAWRALEGEQNTAGCENHGRFQQSLCAPHTPQPRNSGLTQTQIHEGTMLLQRHRNNPFVCPPLHFPPGKKTTKINYCIIDSVPEQDPLNTELLSCHHYFETAIHIFSPLAFTSLTIFPINAIWWENQIQNSTDRTGFPPFFWFVVGFWFFVLNNYNLGRRSQKTHWQEMHFLHCLNNVCGKNTLYINKTSKIIHQLLNWSFPDSTAIVWLSQAVRKLINALAAPTAFLQSWRWQFHLANVKIHEGIFPLE